MSLTALSSEMASPARRELQRAYDRALAERFRHRLPASTVDALHYVIAQKDPATSPAIHRGANHRTNAELIRAHFP